MATSHSTLKIEPGEYYKTRGGLKAYVAAECPGEITGIGTWVGFLQYQDGRWIPKIWNRFGINDVSETLDVETNYDITGPWPETVRVWFKRYEGGGVTCFYHKPKTLGGETVWCQEVEITPPPEEEPPF